MNKKISGSIALLIIPMLITFSACTKSSGTLVLSGTVESTQVDINSEVSGKIIKLEKDEGLPVKKGDILAVVDSSNQELVVRQQEAVVKMKQAKLDELIAGTRSEQIKQAEASVDTSKSGVSSAKTAVDNAQINYDYLLNKYNKIKSLHDSGAVSDNDLNDAKYKADTANQQFITTKKQLDSAQSQLQAAQSQLDLLREGSTGQSIKAAEADLEQSQAALDQAKLLLGKYEIKSPIDGTYLAKNASVGDMVSTGSSIGTVSDLSDLWVNVYIPQRNLNSVRLNQDIALKTISLQDKAIKGKIVFIAGDAEFTPKNTETTEAKENTVYRLKIKVIDNLDKLKPGMTVDAVIPLGG